MGQCKFFFKIGKKNEQSEDFPCTREGGAVRDPQSLVDTNDLADPANSFAVQAPQVGLPGIHAPGKARSVFRTSQAAT
jgi:hypothetical protein